MVITENNGSPGTIQPKLKSHETHFTTLAMFRLKGWLPWLFWWKKNWTKSGTLSQSKRRQLAGEPSCSVAGTMNKCTKVQNGFSYLLWLQCPVQFRCVSTRPMSGAAQTQWPRYPCVEVRRKRWRRRSKRSRKSDCVKERKLYCKQDCGV